MRNHATTTAKDIITATDVITLLSDNNLLVDNVMRLKRWTLFYATLVSHTILTDLSQMLKHLDMVQMQCAE